MSTPTAAIEVTPALREALITALGFMSYELPRIEDPAKAATHAAELALLQRLAVDVYIALADEPA